MLLLFLFLSKHFYQRCLQMVPHFTGLQLGKKIFHTFRQVKTRNISRPQRNQREEGSGPARPRTPQSSAAAGVSCVGFTPPGPGPPRAISPAAAEREPPNPLTPQEAKKKCRLALVGFPLTFCYAPQPARWPHSLFFPVVCILLLGVRKPFSIKFTSSTPRHTRGTHHEHAFYFELPLHDRRANTTTAASCARRSG